MEPKKKKSFVGNVKPHVELDGMALKVVFGEPFALEEWQTAHPTFVYALKSGWVLSSDQNALVLNPLEGVVRRSPFGDVKEAVTSDVSKASGKAAEAGMDPTLLHEILERQSLAMSNLTLPPIPAPSQDATLLKELVEQQRSLIGLLSQQRSESSPDVVNLLKEIKDSLANPKGTVTYNKADPGKEGFKVVEVQPERVVSKIEDLNVKSANIVTQQHSTGGVDDALAALKKLKGK